MSDSIDYQALFEQVRLENEALRLGMLKSRLRTRVNVSQKLIGIRDFVEQNYLVLVFAVILLSTLCSGVYVLWHDKQGGV
jgi:hypothetical protein